MNRYGFTGQYIRQCREASGITQGDLGKQLKLSSAQSVSNWERGIAKPTPNHWPKMIKICGMTFDGLKKAMLKDVAYGFMQSFKRVSK